VLENGAKVIYVNAFLPFEMDIAPARRPVLRSHLPPDRLSYWKRHIEWGSDGGCSFWRLLYDVERHEFIALACNGEA
jgi:hypothetical protein